MHYCCTTMAFVCLKEKHLKKAFAIANPSAVLPNWKKLAGSFLNMCYAKVKAVVDLLLSNTSKNVCVTTDRWSNIANKAVVNYMVITGDKSLFLEAVPMETQSHT